MKRHLVIGLGLFILVVGLGIGQHLLERRAAAQTKGTVQAPRFEVDPMWPKPLPNGWYLGMTIGVWVDAQDRIWIVHRPDSLNADEAAAAQNPPTGDCCKPAPPILAFNQAGEIVASWGGPGDGYEWPASNHGIFVDHKGFVWIGGNGGPDAHILKFTQDGKFVRQFGRSGGNKGSNDPDNFGRVAKVFVEPKANETYVADGYLNKRVAVIDAETGKMKRYWGAYGNKPDDTNLGPYRPGEPPAQQFRNPVHCADVSNDGLVYVCDRPNDRIQVFTTDGKFVKEVFIAPDSLADGSTWDVAFSRDPQQRYLFVADGRNQKIRILDRQTLEELTNFGEGGRQPGQFYGVHSIAIDSKGNLYTTETYEGRRLQKFVFKGIGPVTAKEQGTVWPRTGKS